MMFMFFYLLLDQEQEGEYALTEAAAAWIHMTKTTTTQHKRGHRWTRSEYSQPLASAPS